MARLRTGINPHRIPHPLPDRGTAEAIASLSRRLSDLESTYGAIGAGSVGPTQVGQIDGTTNIITGSITTGSIAAGAITATTIAAGAISAYVISGQSITLASSLGSTPKVLLDNTGIKAYDGSGVQQLSISATDGSLTASKGTITGAVIQTGGLAAATAAANKVAMDSGGIKAWDALANQTVAIDTTGTLIVARGSLTFSGTIPAGTGARLTIDATGLKAYNASNQNLVTIDAASGLITATGIITAQTGSAIPTATITGFMPGSANRYSNSAFQDGAGNFSTTGWTLAGFTGSDGGTTVPPVYGGHTCKLIPTTGASNSWVGPSSSIDPSRRVVPGLSYTLSHFVWPATVARNSQIQVQWYNASGVQVGSTVSGAVQPTTLGTWNRISSTFVAPAGAVYAYGLHYPGNGNQVTDTYYIQAFQLEEGDRASAWAPRPDEILFNSINANMIQAGTITATQINTVSFNAVGLAAINANLGTITSGTINTATVQTSSTATSTGGVVFNASGLTGYNSSGATIFGLTSSGLTLTAIGAAGINVGGGVFTVSSAGALVATSATVTGTITTSSLTVTGLGSGGINVGGGAFTVSSGGAVVATNATITGAITATSGAISGNLIVSGALQTSATGASTWLDSTGLRVWDSTPTEMLRINHTNGIAIGSTNTLGVVTQSINFNANSVTGTNVGQIFAYTNAPTSYQMRLSCKALASSLPTYISVNNDSSTPANTGIVAHTPNHGLVILDDNGLSDFLQKSKNLGETVAGTARDNLGLGTTQNVTFNSVTASEASSITGGTNTQQLNVKNTLASTFTSSIVRSESGPGAGSGWKFFLAVAATNTTPANQWYVRGDGQMFSTTTTIGVISDRSLKDNIRDLEGCMDILRALGSPRQFTWSNHRLNHTRMGERGYGVVAQEVEGILPHLIDDFDVSDETGEQVKSFGYAGLIPFLVGATQELDETRLSVVDLALLAGNCSSFEDFQVKLGNQARNTLDAQLLEVEKAHFDSMLSERIQRNATPDLRRHYETRAKDIQRQLKQLH